ncbi:MAG: extracellular solute-binding protein [Lachnospiraceae bacterium]|nr:extracellular solute-binding protein [Lachnospiraceae bacterium]
MRANTFFRSKAFIIAVCLIAAGVIVLFAGSGSEENYSAKYAGYDLSDAEGTVVREGTYASYISAHEGAALPQTTITADVSKPDSASGAHAEGSGLYTEEESSVTWKLTIAEAGFYNISFGYIPVESRSIDAERTVLINGELPFKNASYIGFTRMWHDAGEIKTDNQGNEIRPSQAEVIKEAFTLAKDTSSGYESEPYMFYFNKGENEITLVGVTEPLILTKLALTPVSEIQNYDEYIASLGKTVSTDGTWSCKIQGESAILRSDPSIYPIFEHASSNTDPYSVSVTKLNAIGGDAWRVAGQWIEWEFEVPSDGFYNIGFKGKQNFERGKTSSRLLTIDGVTPFKEAADISFSYSNSWEFSPVAGDGTDAEIYLTSGTHTLRLEVTLGELGSSLSKLEDSSFRLNQIYRQILVVMGREPDKYRDYGITKIYPDLPDAMLLESRRLYSIVDEIIAYSGGKSSKTGSIVSLANILEEMAAHPETQIQRKLSTFRSYISALGTTIQSLSESKLDIDYFIIKEPGAEWPDDSENIFGSIAHGFKSLIASFTTDYNSVGDTYDSEEDDDVLEVWILTGRDQSNILKSMIDDSFTPESGIKVNLKLVAQNAVLSAVVAGNGPDVLLSATHTEPVNYAMRNAAIDLTRFDDYDEIAERFTESAKRSFAYKDGVYALPETQTFSLLYYRTDILEELGLEVPETWEDLINMIPTLQQNNMEMGMPDVMGKGSTDLSGLFAIMYQNGVELYGDDDMAQLDSEGAVEAFEYYVQFYTKHDQPTEYTFADRFRAGEMPIGISTLSLYNTLSVSAPDLKGLWSFALIPGTREADGTVDHTTFSTGTASMLLRNEDEAMIDRGWEFLKWWSSSETQTRFGREMESVLGAAGRYATANFEAVNQLAWSKQELDIINAQREQSWSNREVPGGYYTSRQIINAIRKTVNDSAVPRETLLDYNQAINDEIIKKQKEFGLR